MQLSSRLHRLEMSYGVYQTFRYEIWMSLVNIVRIFTEICWFNAITYSNKVSRSNKYAYVVCYSNFACLPSHANYATFLLTQHVCTTEESTDSVRGKLLRLHFAFLSALGVPSPCPKLILFILVSCHFKIQQ